MEQATGDCFMKIKSTVAVIEICNFNYFVPMIFLVLYIDYQQLMN